MSTERPTQDEDSTFEIKGNGELSIGKVNSDDREI